MTAHYHACDADCGFAADVVAAEDYADARAEADLLAAALTRARNDLQLVTSQYDLTRAELASAQQQLRQQENR